MPLRLETERLIVRPFAMDDLDALHTILDQNVQLYGVSLSREDRAVWLTWAVLNEKQLEAMHQPPYGDRAVTLKATGEVIGAIGYVPLLMPFGTLPYFIENAYLKPDGFYTAEVGLYYALATAHHRKGYATEAARAMIQHAFHELHLKRITATTEYTNEASMGVMRKLGMTLQKNPNKEPFWFEVVGVLENPLAAAHHSQSE